MKLIITESKYKHILFKAFDKLGGKVDNNLISLFRLEGNKGAFTYDQAYKYLIEWRGEKESKELAKTLLLQNPHRIDEYGGYNFFLEVVGIGNWYLDSSEPNVVVKVKVDDLAGSVDIDGDNMSLEDALDNDDYGWEIEDEVNWGIDEYFKENITSKTGIKVIFDRPKYSSRIFNFN
jgi:hypothetical protein